MRLKHIEIAGFKSFAKKSTLSFDTAVTAVVGPNGSGKSNVVEAFRFVLGEQSMKSMRGKTGADLIFRGSNHTSKLSRASVSITFDNKDNVFSFPIAEESKSKAPVLFNEVVFTRELFADGTSKYLMNGTEVRLKQMVELLSSVNIGASSHHIISQGEADSILRASTRERREMLEEALGLKLYHYRIKESESKLLKSTETLKDVQSLRRELAPHIKFLQKQVEKIEKGRVIRTELEDAMLKYLSTEKSHLENEESRINEATHTVGSRKDDLEMRLANLPKENISDDNFSKDISTEKEKIEVLRDKRRQVESRIGRLEGMIEVERRLLNQVQKKVDGPSVSFGPSEYEQLISDIEHFLKSLSEAKEMDEVGSVLDSLHSILASLKSRRPETIDTKSESVNDSNLKEIAIELEGFERDLKKIISEEQSLYQIIKDLEQKRELWQREIQSSTATKYEIQNELTQCNAELQILGVTKSAFIERKEYFDSEIKEAAFIFGPQFLHALKNATPIPELNLHDFKRNIDRLKIRLDEHSGIGNDVVGEYESTMERDAFLSREVTDIEGSIKNLETLIIDLKKILDQKFTTGVETINERFGEFFKTMFGGGSAFLSITIEKKKKRKIILEEGDMEMEEEPEGDDRFMERGIDVHVSLPEKKVKELNMLSGGERSLVSIALLFAISQVNPPPFLVLDETDAALDEANSRRYGDMVERLSEYSQLIVVTHNRETMSRASVLYGVTLGSDGGSKLLSIKFDEAVKVAK